MTKRRNRNGHYIILAEVATRTQQSVRTLTSIYLLKKMLWCVGILLLVEFSKYLESFSMIKSGIRYIIYDINSGGLLFIESPSRKAGDKDPESQAGDSQKGKVDGVSS